MKVIRADDNGQAPDWTGTLVEGELVKVEYRSRSLVCRVTDVETIKSPSSLGIPHTHRAHLEAIPREDATRGKGGGRESA